MQTHKMGTDDGGSDPLNKRSGWNTVRLDFLKEASGSNGGGVKSNSNVDNNVDGRLELRNSSRSIIRDVLNQFSALSGQQHGTHALKWLTFIRKNDKPWDKRFEELKNENDGLLYSSSFGECIGMDKHSNQFAEYLFKSLCGRRNITGDPLKINKDQFKEFWDEICDHSFDSRLRIFLDMVDKDKNGRITKDEVAEIIVISASANKLSTIQRHANQYATLIMEEIDTDNLGYIMINKLEKLLKDAATHNGREEAHPSSESTRHQPEPTHNPIKRWYKVLKYFLDDNWKRCWVVLLWIGVMIGLFTWKYIQYKNRAVYNVLGSCVCIAKGAAETLKLNMTIVLLPVCRNTITWFRNKTKFGVAVPFDDNINFHQVIALAIAIGVGLHVIAHLACDFPRLIHATEEEYKPLQQYFGDQAKNYSHFFMEVEGYTGIIMVVLMTIAFTLAWLRQGKLRAPLVFEKLTKLKAVTDLKLYKAFATKLKRFITFLNKVTGFNLFWYSHHLFVIVYAMLIVHGIKLYLIKEWYKKTTWMYLAVPMSLYACERLTRTFRSHFEPVRILKVTSYPSGNKGDEGNIGENGDGGDEGNKEGGVLALRITKPQGFKYKSGQYMFVKCAAVSPFEWHPFSITSAPGDDYLSVHIRDLGDWTKSINKVFSNHCSLDKRTRIRRADFLEENPNVPRVRIDGPYGAPSYDYKNYEVVLLVGLGIGATPMISIVKNIVNNIKAKEENENALEDGSSVTRNRVSPTTANEFKTKKAYFYWVTSEQESFDWFEGVMDEIAEVDKNGAIEMHMHCSSVHKEGDARSALISMLQSLNHAKNGVDVVSGTRFKSHFGRPDWSDVCNRIATNHRDSSEIGVFYCGKPEAWKELKKSAAVISQDKSTLTKFVFHKENF